MSFYASAMEEEFIFDRLKTLLKGSVSSLFWQWYYSLNCDNFSIRRKMLYSTVEHNYVLL